LSNLLNYVLFQGVWLAAVYGASEGRPWQGMLAAALMLLVHLALVQERWRELRFVLLVGLLGSLADSLLSGLGFLSYAAPGRAWSGAWVPPWIAALWLAVGMMPAFSLSWLRGRLLLAAALGALGGPLSFLAGERVGVVASTGQATWVCLALEYALVMPLLLLFAPSDSVRSAEAEVRTSA
jgi:hypothetical protein